MNGLKYAGDVSPRACWNALENNENAVLVDVRTPEEWAYVGIVDLAALARDPVYVPWLTYPKMAPNPDFTQALRARVGDDPDRPLFFLCRSGQRSAKAAAAMTALGYRQCHNIAHGFEGDRDAQGHRGTVNGWKVDGLPWVQG